MRWGQEVLDYVKTGSVLSRSLVVLLEYWEILR